MTRDELLAELEAALDELVTKGAKAEPVPEWVGAIWQGDYTGVYLVGD